MSRAQSRLILVALAVTLAWSPQSPAVSPVEATSSDDIAYVYDELGRLVAVTDPASDTAVYTYDPVGNITEIERYDSSDLSLIEFTPNNGGIGRQVTLFGTGFSATANNNEVRFSGTLAAVTQATATQLVASVPSGATDGAISVTVGGTTTHSRTAFIVGDPDAPTLNGFTPPIGAAGSTVTISGTELGEVEPTRVRLNTNFAVASSVSSTEIVTTIPPGTGSGRFTVATPYGVAESPADFFVPPPGFTVGQIGYTGRLASDVNHPFTLSTSCKTALFAFDGAAGGRVAWQWSAMTFPNAGDATVFRPDLGTLVGSHTATNAFHDSVTLPVDGTYSLRYTPRSCGTGSGTLRVWDVPPDDVEPITIDGPPGTVTTTVAGQNAKFTFAAAAGQRIAWSWSGLSFTNGSDTALYKPDGSTLVGSHTTANGFHDIVSLPVSGTYSLTANPRSSGTGSRWG